MAAHIVGKPQQMEMENKGHDSKIEEIFGHRDALLVKQTMRGCCQECMGCEAKSEFLVSDMQLGYLEDGYKISEAGMKQENILYAIEKSSFCMRLCWRDGRAWDMAVSEGNGPGGAPVVDFHKPCGCPLWFTVYLGDNGKVDCPCCCFLPEVTATTAGGASLNSKSRYITDLCFCVPKLEYSEDGQPLYLLKPETCCFGCCLACHCGSCRNLSYVPFYFHDPKTGDVLFGSYDSPETPQIRKVWAGFKKECFSTADTFAVFFPKGISAKRKAGILGMTFLLDFTVFERQQEK